MKSLFVFMTLLMPIHCVFSQEVVQAPPTFHDPNSINKTMPAPIDVVVPYHQQVAVEKAPIVQKVDNVYNVIKGSTFFLEVNPLSLKTGRGDFESNNVTNDVRDLELDASLFQFKLMPLNFKFGFENDSWGSFAEIDIENGDDSSELVVYGKVSDHKFGFGLQFSSEEVELDLKAYGVKKIDAKVKETKISPYFYYSFGFINNESFAFEHWMKIGGSYSNTEVDDLRIKGLEFFINPAIDIMFKINSKLQIGSGIELEYRRFSGEYEAKNVKPFKGIGNSFAMEFNIIKTKFIF